MLTAQIGQVPDRDLTNILASINIMDPSTITKVLTQLGIPEVDFWKAYQTGGMPAVQQAAVMAAAKTDFVQDFFKQAQTGLAKVAGEQTAKKIYDGLVFVYAHWPWFVGIGAYLVFRKPINRQIGKLFSGGRAPTPAMANARRRKKSRRHGKRRG